MKDVTCKQKKCSKCTSYIYCMNEWLNKLMNFLIHRDLIWKLEKLEKRHNISFMKQVLKTPHMTDSDKRNIFKDSVCVTVCVTVRVTIVSVMHYVLL